MVFDPVFPEENFNKKSTLIARQILRKIREGQFRPGEKLPSEREIAEQMRVSRGAVREALSALRIAGIVTIRLGEGTYVADSVNEVDSVSTALRVLEDNESPLEVWEARQFLEAAIGELALQNVTEAAIGRMVQFFREMEAAVERDDYEGYLRANRTFHGVFTELADNSILARFANQLLAATDQVLTKETTYDYLKDYLPRSLEKHQRILDAVLARDPDAFRQSIHLHFEDLKRFLLDESRDGWGGRGDEAGAGGGR